MSSRTEVKLPLIAVVGNPNAGKTTLFNLLSGARQKVANYPGVTVEKIEADVELPAGGRATLVDVPGLYSMAAVSEDERVAVAVAEGRENHPRPDALVCVLDAANLERHLFLFSQVAELRLPTLVVLTMADRLEKQGRKISLAALSEALGVPVIASRAAPEDRARLLSAIERVLRDGRVPSVDLGFPDDVEAAVSTVRDRLARMGVDAGVTAVRRAILHPDEPLGSKRSELPDVRAIFDDARLALGADLPKPGYDSSARYRWAAVVAAEVEGDAPPPRKSRTDAIDRVLTHRFFGLLIFAAVMYGVFFSIYTLAGPAMDLIDGGFGTLGDFIRPNLDGVPWFRDLLVDGVIAGVGGMLVFLPQILILFFFISVLEGTGYLARAAFLMDKLLGWCGLNGRAFIPLLSSFACAIPGIMAARVMPDGRSRLATILVAPLMSCSARLPVYLLLIGAFIEPRFGAGWAGFALFAMHLLGLVVAIPVAWIFNRGVIRGRRLPFLLELPPYQWPRWRDVGLAMLSRGKIFVRTAGTIIVVMSVLIWASLHYPGLDPAKEATIRETTPPARVEARLQEAAMENSLLGRTGRTIEPIFRPAGFDWRLTTAILAAFPAREVVVPSLGILFENPDADETSVDLRGSLQRAKWPDGRPLVTPWTAVGFMVFFALCAQCSSTLAAVRRETGTWKWAAVMFFYMTGLAYLGAVVVNWLGLWLGR